MSGAQIVRYRARAEMMQALAGIVAGEVAEALAARGRAGLALPGGSTPAPFLRALGMAALDWERVSVLPSDERLVAPDDERSNARLIGETLFAGPAGAARFVPLGNADGIGDAAARVAALLPLDVAVLGMGADGHTASLFPDAPELDAALAAEAPAVVTLRPEGQPEGRASLSARVLRGARRVHLLIAGAQKWDALHVALKEGPVGEAPVRAVLTAPGPVKVHYAD